MSNLLVSYALPNPAGKDRSASGVSNNQLNGEWVEFKNNINQPVSLDGVSLVHQTYNQSCQRTGYDVLTPFSGTLGVGQSIRVHTGTGQGYQEGNVIHLFLNRGNYVWNNRCGDSVILQAGNSLVDWAAYGSNPPEGRILTRAIGQNWLS
jgi:hypothetical protein